jgi:hypothetical protein
MFSGHALACSKQLLNLIAPFRTSPLSCCQPFFKLWRLQLGYQSIYWLSWKPKMAKITTHEAAGKQLGAMAAAHL